MKKLIMRILSILFELLVLFIASVAAMYYLAAAFARFIINLGPDPFGK